MTWQALTIIFGTLVFVVAVLICGLFVGGWWGTAMVVGGIIGLMAWIVSMFEIGSDMTSGR